MVKWIVLFVGFIRLAIRKQLPAYNHSHNQSIINEVMLSDSTEYISHKSTSSFLV